MTSTTIILLVLAATIILVLGSYAAFLMFKLRHLRQQQALLLEQQLQKQIVRDLKVINSIVLISKAVDEAQCEISEGCWRLSVLMDSLPKYSESFNVKFPAIFMLYSKIKHMPILDARKQLSKKDKLSLDLERMGHEQALEPEVIKSVRELIPYASALQIELRQKEQQ